MTKGEYKQILVDEAAEIHLKLALLYQIDTTPGIYYTKTVLTEISRLENRQAEVELLWTALNS